MRFVEQIRKKWKSRKDRGAAMIITLMVMLILVLLALALVQQSQTEYLIARNEEDAQVALDFAEAGLDWADRKISDYLRQPVAPPDLDDILNGPDNASTTDDFLFGFGDFAASDENDFTSANESGRSAIVNRDFGFGDGSQKYEVFRMGSGDKRALVYVRSDDNYDTAMDTDDTDFRMRVRSVAEYPIFVKSDGTVQSGEVLRGTAVRRLIGSFEPAGHVAIRTDGDLDIHGSLEICGECGGAHANGNLDLGDGDYCAEVTATASIDVGDASGARGGAGLAGPVFIPKINPYDDRYVPTPSLFDTQTTPETGVPASLQCPELNATTDPGASKYFALVLKTINDNDMLVYKAYWDPTYLHWVWRLIDDKLDNADTLNAVLDNCGRLVSSTINESTGTPVVLTPDPFAGTGVVDGGASEFYGFSVGNGSKYNTFSCSDADSLSGVAWNDFTHSAFPKMTEPPVWPQVTGTTTSAPSSTPFTNIPPLPSSKRTSANMVLTSPGYATNTDSPSTVDFVSGTVITNNKGEWDSGSSIVYSPFYGATVFFYGNVNLHGNLNNLKYVNAGAQTTVALPNTRWRITIISYGNITVSGNPAYAQAFADLAKSCNNAPCTAPEDFAFQMVAGRDIRLGGTPGGGPGSQDQCPSMAPGSDCTAAPGLQAGFEGIYLAHEQVEFAGNVTMDGFIIAEDSPNCSPAQSNDSRAYGSVQIHYDCEHPPDPWGNQNSRMVSWEEVR